MTMPHFSEPVNMLFYIGKDFADVTKVRNLEKRRLFWTPQVSSTKSQSS